MHRVDSLSSQMSSNLVEQHADDDVDTLNPRESRVVIILHGPGRRGGDRVEPDKDDLTTETPAVSRAEGLAKDGRQTDGVVISTSPT